MPTTILDLWQPEIWRQGLAEKAAKYPAFSNSGALVRNAEFDALASGGGVSVHMPFYKDITGQDDEIQLEASGPAEQKISAGTQISPVLNRVTKHSVTALSGAVSDSDPVAQILDQLAAAQMMQRNRTAVAILRGLCGTGSVALNGAAALSATRLIIGTETGASPPAGQVFSANTFVDAKAIMGELQADLATGAFLAHPTVLATLEKADALNFQSGVSSGLPFTIRTYRGVPVYISEALVRAGTTSGFIYDSYLIVKGALAHGEKPKATDTGTTLDVAALQFDRDTDVNIGYIYNRSRFLIHARGTSWTGTAAGQSATNAELATPSKWSLVYSSANRVGIVAIQSNG